MSPDFVLMQQEGQEHELTTIMDHPPDVNVASHAVLVARKPVDALGNQHSQLPLGCNTDALCRRHTPPAHISPQSHTNHTHMLRPHPPACT